MWVRNYRNNNSKSNKKVTKLLMQRFMECGFGQSRYHSWLIVSIIGFAMSYVSTRANAAPMNVPQPIQVPGNVTYLYETKASGYQIYRCEADSKGNYQWALKAPDATLYNAQGKTFGSHYAGPTWQANDGSHVVGEVEAKIASPNDANAVAWLLLKVKARGGNGIFNNVTYINRINTEGGQAPKDTCNQTRLGDEYRAHYSTVYYFYGSQDDKKPKR